ncbi:MAG: DUF2085 domain-containing protein [Anaerolineales bacterium]|nr:DUF2085 domain-containing protein [Anaerolineales bacterium]
MSETTLKTAPASPLPASSRALPWLVLGVTLVALLSWLWTTPPGLLGKADAVGYAICHRLDLRSFHLGDRQLPLCARCTGTYLGVVLSFGVLAALGRGRAGGVPRGRVLFALLGFIGLMGLDGLNSYLTLFPGLPHLYEPNNTLRLITGALNGLALAGLMFPVLNQTLWRDWQDRPVIGSLRQLLLLVLLAGGVVALVLTEAPVVLYPLALLSAAGVLVILVSLNTTILLIVTRRENRASAWPGALLPLLAGFALAIIQIGVVDAARFAIFGSWGGLPIPG